MRTTLGWLAADRIRAYVRAQTHAVAPAAPHRPADFVARLRRSEPTPPIDQPVLIRSEVRDGVLGAEIEALID